MIGMALLTDGAGVRVSRPVAQQSVAGIWFGLSPLSGGRTTEDRFQVVVTGASVVIMSAPFGKAPVSWGPVVQKGDSAIEFRWADDPSVSCTLRRADERTYEGTCRGPGQAARPLTLTRNRPVDGLDLPVSDADLAIVGRARQLLSSPAWNRHDDRYCEDDARDTSWSLFCALYQASVDVTGQYLHFRPAVTETRAAIGDVTNGRRFNQILLEYNNDSSTTYANIAGVFDRATARLEARRECETQRGATWSAEVRLTSPIARDAIPSGTAGDFFWGENTAQRGTYGVQSFVGPLTTTGRVPDEWLTASAVVTVRTWKRGDVGGLDLTGELPNGNRWRYFSQCGEALSFHDVPASTSAFFNRIIAGYFRDANDRQR